MADFFVSRFGCYTIIRDTTQHHPVLNVGPLCPIGRPPGRGGMVRARGLEAEIASEPGAGRAIGA